MAPYEDDHIHDKMVPRTEEEIEKIVKRLRRIEGQVRYFSANFRHSSGVAPSWNAIARASCEPLRRESDPCRERRGIDSRADGCDQTVFQMKGDDRWVNGKW